MIKQVTTRGLPGIENGAITAAIKSNVNLVGFTLNRNFEMYGLTYPSIIERPYILDNNRNIAQGSLIFNIDNKYKGKLETFLDYISYDHHLYCIKEFSCDELKNIINWIEYNNITKLNIHGHLGFEEVSCEFFKSIFEKE